MPTQTFLNLPQKKQDKILAAAKNEFREYAFYDASINRIVKAAGISRGSFYMYFADKEDLFFYFLADFQKGNQAQLQTMLKNWNGDIIQLLNDIFELNLSDTMAPEYKSFFTNFFAKTDMMMISKLLHSGFDEVENFIGQESEINHILEAEPALRLLKQEEIHNIISLFKLVNIGGLISLCAGDQTVDEVRVVVQLNIKILVNGVLAVAHERE